VAKGKPDWEAGIERATREGRGLRALRPAEPEPQPEPTPAAEKLVMRSFRFRRQQLDRLKAAAEKEEVDESRFLRWLVDRALDAWEQEEEDFVVKRIVKSVPDL
jgi:hypothetical protein